MLALQVACAPWFFRHICLVYQSCCTISVLFYLSGEARLSKQTRGRYRKCNKGIWRVQYRSRLWNKTIWDTDNNDNKRKRRTTEKDKKKISEEDQDIDTITAKNWIQMGKHEGKKKNNIVRNRNQCISGVYSDLCLRSAHHMWLEVDLARRLEGWEFKSEF